MFPYKEDTARSFASYGWHSVIGFQAPTVSDFFLSNVLLIAGLFLLIFIYLVLLIRKRWKNNFLHPQDSKKKSP